MAYEIPAVNLSRFRARVAAMNKAAAKLGVEPVVATEVASYCTLPVLDEAGFIAKRSVEKTTVEVTGAAIKLPGWTFVGTIEHHLEENILRAVPEMAIPETYRTAKSGCDHCHTDRNRTDTFVVVSDTGEYRQVGRTCTRDYLGHIDPEALAQMMTYIAELAEEEDEEFGGGAWVQSAYAPRDVTAIAAAAIRTYGWAKADAGALATAGRVRTWLNGRGREYDEMKREGFAVEAADYDTADTALAWVKAQTEASDYIANLRATARLEAVANKHIGLLASLPVAHKNGLLSEAQRAERQAKWDAEKAARAAAGIEAPEGKTVVKGEVLQTMEQASDYGIQYKMRVQDDRGFTVWSTIPAAILAEVEAGVRVEFTATLKRSDRDATFAFASRPSKAAVLTAVAA